MLDKINPDKLTPMMRQYYDIKMEFKDSILLFRLGDFYEMFFDDAILASKELEIVLTSRSCGLDDKAPMAGIPYHTSDSYINKLVNKGYRVAICEQMEDPSQAEGLVKRGVVKIISPGMNLDAYSDKSYNYLMSIYLENMMVGFSYIDISTGDIFYTELALKNKTPSQIIQDEITKLNPSEILINHNTDQTLKKYLSSKQSIFVSYYDLADKNPNSLMNKLERFFKKKSLQPLKNMNFALISLSSLLDYVYSYEDYELKHFKEPLYIENKKYMQLDAKARKNLDVSKSMDHNNSLIDLLDKTVTPMGSRLLNKWIENPLLDMDEILNRQNYIEAFYNDQNFLNEIATYLENIYDIERIIGKLSYSRANARDLNSLKNSIEHLPQLKRTLMDSNNENILGIANDLDDLGDIYELINSAIVEDAPISINEGGIIKPGYSEDLDKIRNTSILGEEKLKEYQEEQRLKTKISNLKIVHNKNTGYFIDITKSHLEKVPLDYHKVQTLTNSERFITNELKEIETMIFTSVEDTENLENSIFNDIKDQIISQSTRIQNLCNIIALLDLSSCLARIAYSNNYVKPSFDDRGEISISAARHPMIEEVIGNLNFIANDCNINDENLIHIITGPNMSGKSTYLRQTALIIIMAQIGSYVPADKACLPIVDKIFTRIGAADNIIHGDSTFMVEMKEMANIINNASSNSLLLLDEVGRGTSTYDGISIAWAIIEYISSKIKAKTLFATHYQELTQLKDSLDNVENYSIKVDENDKGIVFLYQIEKSSTSQSFGIEVAKLAGLPDSIIKRSKTVLNAIEYSSAFNINKEKLDEQIDFSSHQKNSLINDIKKLDINTMSPMDAFKELNSIIDNARLIEE